MTLVLKSDSAISLAGNAVGNVHDYYGPSDYKLMLNFARQEYIVNGSKVGFSDACSFTRSSVGNYLDSDGVAQQAAADAPRFHSMPNLKEAGLLLERALTNRLASGADGAGFTVPNNSRTVLISWEGSGSVDCADAGLTFLHEVEEGGRKHRFYDRSGAITSTIDVTGTVSNVMVTDSDFAASFVDYSSTRATEELQLTGDALAVLTGGTGTLLCRFALTPDSNMNARTIDMCMYNSASTHGALAFDGSYGYLSISTAAVYAHADGAATNTRTQIARMLGRPPLIAVAGMTFSSYGDEAGVMAYGVYGEGDATAESATPPTAFDKCYISNFPSGLTSVSFPPDAVLTHVIGYDRKVTAAEAQNMAVFGKRF